MSKRRIPQNVRVDSAKTVPVPSGRGLPRRSDALRRMKLAGVDTNLLVALDALLTERSVTRAARRLGVGQPAMSHSLARLREHFNDPLLVPRGRELLLSVKARRLVDAASQAVRAFQGVFENTPGFDPVAHEVFVVACADLFAVRFLPAVIARLHHDTPGVELEVRTLGGRSSDEILTDDVDLAFGVFEEVPPTINQKHLFEDSFVCVVSADHPRVGKTISLDRYIELPHLEVLPAPNARPSERIDRILTAKGMRRRVTMRVPYFSLAAHIVAQSDHVLTMTRAFAEVLAESAPIRCVKLPFEVPPLRFSQIWRRDRDDDQAHRALRDVCARVCTERSILRASGAARRR